MSGLSSSSPPRTTEVSSSRRPKMAARDNNVDSSLRKAARPAREDQRMVRLRVEPSRTGASRPQSAAPCQADPRGSRRSVQLPSANSTMVSTAPTPTPCRGPDRGRSRRTLRQRRVRRRWWIPVPPRGACSRYLSGAAEPRMFTCPSSPAGAKVQPRPSQRLEDQPPSNRESALPLRRQIEVEQPPSWWAPSVQPPSRAHQAAWQRSPGCAPKCRLLSSEPPSWFL
jgi:hypothetical protein